VPLVHDDSLAPHAEQVAQTYATARQAVDALNANRGGLESAAPAPALPPYPPEVANALTGYQQMWREEHATTLNLTVVQYFRYINDTLAEGWNGGQDPGATPVQINQTVTIAGRDGAYIETRQWIARAEVAP
jgi:hypothetical protein